MMQRLCRSAVFLTLAVTGLASTYCGVARANPAPPGYSDFPVVPSEFVSQLPAPRIADDFEVAYGGPISLVEWWGSLSTGPWEVTLYSNSDADPTTPDDGGSSVIVDAFNVQEGSGDIFHYFAFVGGAGWRVTARDSYWLSVASFEPAWTWALGDGQPEFPEFGWQRQFAVESVAADAWAPLEPPSQMAFQVWPTLVPEPETFVLMVFGLAGIGLSRRRRPS
jgi:hypothetical protein